MGRVVLYPHLRAMYVLNLKSGSSTVRSRTLQNEGFEYHASSHLCFPGCKRLADELVNDLCPTQAWKGNHSGACTSFSFVIDDDDTSRLPVIPSFIRTLTYHRSALCSESGFHRTEGGGGEIRTIDLSDEVLDSYLVFSFVRDPVVRMVSSHHEASQCSESPITTCKDFLPLLAGRIGKMQRNPHYLSPAHQLLNMRVRGGRRMRLDWVGRLEHFDEDWARLKHALDPKHRLVKPEERWKLIPPANDDRPGGGGGGSSGLRSGSGKSGTAHAVMQHFQPTRMSSENPRYASMGPRGGERSGAWTAEHIILLCRRYAQDFVCFDYDMPKACIDHADLVVAPCGGVCAGHAPSAAPAWSPKALRRKQAAEKEREEAKSKAAE